MMCENCRNEIATTHIKTTINGLIKEYHLCGSCAEKMGFSDFDLFNFNDLWGTLVSENNKSKIQLKKCDTCGMHFDEFMKKGKIGCEDCYNSFKEDIVQMLLKIHGKTQHKGKVEKTIKAEKKDVKSELISLENELKAAISNEEYETAAQLRDIIRAKKGEINE